MATNNKHLTDIKLVDKLIDKTMDLYEKESISGRDIERLNNIKEEILSRMCEKKIIKRECPCGCISNVEDDWVNFCEQCGEELIEQK